MRTSPPEALMDVLRVVFESGLNYGARICLDDDLPTVRIHVSSQALIVVGVQPPATPGIILKVRAELVGLQDLCSVCSGPVVT